MQQINKSIFLFLFGFFLLFGAYTWNMKIPQMPNFFATPSPTITPYIPPNTSTCTRTITQALSSTATPTLTVTPIENPQAYYPVDKGYVWYYKGYKKSEPKKIYDVKAEIINTQTVDGKEYYYYYAPEFNIRSFLRKDGNGVYMKIIRYPYPVLDFMSIDIYFYPEIKFVDFNARPGDEWVEKVSAQTQVLTLKIERNITAKFKFVAIEKIKVGDKKIEAFHIRNNIDQGDGVWHIEDNWYGKGVGYAGGENENQYAKLYKVEINSTTPTAATAGEKARFDKK